MIKVTDGFYIQTSKYDYALLKEQTSVSEDGEEKLIYKPLGYYTSIRSCLKALAEHWARLEYKNKDIDLPGFCKAISDKIDEYEQYVSSVRF